MTGVEIHALAGAYALDAVDDIERAAFDRHLRECSACAIEVAELRETAARLSDPVSMTPPGGLRDSVLAAVARTPQERARRMAPSGPAALTRWRRWTAAAVAAGIMAVGVGAATWAVSQQQIQAERKQIADVQGVLGAPDARLVASDMAGGRVTLVVSPSHDAAVAVLSGLASPGQERLYQLWMIGGTPQPKSVGMLPVAQGSGTTYIRGLGGASTFAISREKAGGATQPSAPIGQLQF
jgi:anti-sigma-K factor RskA